MIDNEKLRLFIEEIKSVCERHRLGLVGTCDLEGVYGEITIFDLDDPDTWGDPNVMLRAYNFEPLPASAEAARQKKE